LTGFVKYDRIKLEKIFTHFNEEIVKWYGQDLQEAKTWRR
jgi:hypothetical protein